MSDYLAEYKKLEAELTAKINANLDSIKKDFKVINGEQANEQKQAEQEKMTAKSKEVEKTTNVQALAIKEKNLGADPNLKAPDAGAAKPVTVKAKKRSIFKGSGARGKAKTKTKKKSK